MEHEPRVRRPAPDTVLRREQIAQNPLLRALFPCTYIDPVDSLRKVENLNAGGYGITVVVAPHPAVRDSIDAARGVINSGVFREQPILAPVAIHQLESKIHGSILRYISGALDVKLRPIVTVRSMEKYPDRYTSNQRNALTASFLADMVEYLSAGGIVAEYLHGDRAGTLDVPPPRGVVALPHAYMKRRGFLSAAYLFAYIHNPSVRHGKDIRGFSPGVPYTMVFGDLVTYEEAEAQAGSLSPPKGLEKLDYWAYRKIADIYRNALESQIF